MLPVLKMIWAMIWQNQQNGVAPSEDTDHPVWSESSLCDQWVAKDPRFLHADSKDSDQTGRMPRLIWVFAGRTLTLLVLSCHGSYTLMYTLYVRINKTKSSFLFSTELTHICLVDPSILISWTSPFPILGVSDVLFHFYSITKKKKKSCKKTMKTLIRRSVCTVCLCPQKRTLGLYGLNV